VLRETHTIEQTRRLERDPYVRMVFRQLPGAVWATDPDLCLTYVAGRLARNVGPRAKAGMTVFDILGTRDPANPVIAGHRAALLGKPQSLEYRFGGRWYRILIDQLKDHRRVVAGCIAAAFDITELHVTKEQLARSEALLEQAQRLAHVGSFEWDIATNRVIWSDELYRVYGIEPGQFGGTYEAFLERAHPNDLERVKSVLFDAFQKGGPFIYDHRIIRADGSVRVLHTRGDVLPDDSGRAVCVAGCCWDVTEMKETMDNLEHVRSLLEGTIDATADGLLVVDSDGKVTAYNKRFLSLWRIPKELAQECDDKKLLDYVHDQLDDPEQFMRGTQYLYSHQEEESFDVQHFKDGRVFERYSCPQRISSQIVGRVWSFRDITERDKLIRRTMFLSDATRLLSSLDVEPALGSVAHLAVPFMGDVCAIDLLASGQPRRLLTVSLGGAQFFEPELHQAVKKGHSTIYSAGARSCLGVPLLVKDAVLGAMTFVGSRNYSYDETDLEFAETLSRRAALSVENARLFRGAQEALRSRDEFLGIAAHEIRGPITSVHMAVQGLQKKKLSAPDTAKVLEIIEREDRRLARFVDELLDLARIQNGQLPLKLEDVDLGDVVRESSSALNLELARSGSALSTTIEGRPVGRWDKFRLTQVVTNLLANAIKFGEGKPIVIGVKEDCGLATLTVKDHGIGIEQKDLPRIFKPFERAVSPRNYGGLGLGLFIVRTIVEGLGGTIRVDSTPQAGTTVSVELPT
jgi:PAS domain S-box-containing protein